MPETAATAHIKSIFSIYNPISQSVTDVISDLLKQCWICKVV